MEVKLTKKPKKGCVIVEGFPGFGFVSTIATEFLLDHLKFEKIGQIYSEDFTPLAIVHNSEIKYPLEIFYDSKNNIIVVEGLTMTSGLEWEIAEALVKLYEEIGAKELISLEGVQSPSTKAPNAFFLASTRASETKLKKIGLKGLQEGIVLGVSGALLLSKKPKLNATFIFSETMSNLPDSRSAAKVIEVLDDYLGLKVDYKPLLKKAEGFEGKLKELMKKTLEASKEKAKREEAARYVG